MGARLPSLKVVLRDIGFVAAGAPISLVAPAILALSPILLRHKIRSTMLGGHLAAAGAVAIVVPIVVDLACVPALTSAQRRRFASLGGLDLGRPAAGGARRVRRMWEWLGRGSTWRQITYHVIVGPVLEVGGLLVFALLGLGLSLIAVVPWLSSFHGTHPLHVKIILALAGLAIVFVDPWLIAAVCRLDRRAARALLGPNETERLLATVTESRSGLVVAADAERRRIERDLHDGAQARLVSLAMTLGLARATRSDFPEDAKQLIADAHDEAITAIEELRDVVRGLHPAVLDELGLDAALSGLAARTSLPVSLKVQVGERVSPTIEAVAYFVVSEALANVVKHANATRADVAVQLSADILRVQVRDDGVGGADAAAGSGIDGLAQRVSSVDGVFRIDSPRGGPTTLTAELPCAS